MTPRPPDWAQAELSFERQPQIHELAGGESAPVGKAPVSLDGTFTRMNPAFARIAGWSE